MSVPTSAIPNTPFTLQVSPVLNAITPLVTGVTLTTPTVATLVTGLTMPITIPNLAQFVVLTLTAPGINVTAGASIFISAYQGVTTGALTTVFGTVGIVAPTGGTTIPCNYQFILPVTTAMYGTTIFLSIAGTASTGNFAMSASSTSPINLIATVL